MNPQERHLRLMQEIQPDSRWQTGEDAAAWQVRARERLRELLGLPLTASTAHFRPEWTREDDPRWIEHRFLVDTEPDVSVPCHLVLPRAAQGKLPLVICLQGHGTGMHISLGRTKHPGDEADFDGDRDFACQAVARGFAALTLEQRGFGECGACPDGQPDCRQIAMQALLLGRTLIGERCWDVSRAIDVVAAHFPMIDMERILLMGNSGGGTTTLYAAALDERITAAMPSCALCGYMASIGARQHCWCNYVPRVMCHFDMGDVAALIAPRPLVAVNGATDTDFPVDSAREQVGIAARVYAALDAPGMLRHVVGAQGHRFYAAQAWPVFDELTGWTQKGADA